MPTLITRDLNKAVIVYSNGKQVFKGRLQDFISMSYQEKQALKVTTFEIRTEDET
ncbi:hypothetical protein [Bacillus mycoides]|uniref:hypothetical protein n=1 Tax=Bacillus mycoides TaxID=1405 RepID=UPI0014956F28|nr:hypothetical protein [Bacillus mycoides]